MLLGFEELLDDGLRKGEGEIDKVDDEDDGRGLGLGQGLQVFWDGCWRGWEH